MLPKREDVLDEVVTVVLDQVAELFVLRSLLRVVGISGWYRFFVLALVVEGAWNHRTLYVLLEVVGLFLQLR